jgi:transcriptional coactivator HFI1/ADA1
MNPADLSITISPTLTTKVPATPSAALNKNGKIPIPRVDLESIYVQLKAALGDQWADYKAAVNAFTLGTWQYSYVMTSHADSMSRSSEPS